MKRLVEVHQSQREKGCIVTNPVSDTLELLKTSLDGCCAFVKWICVEWGPVSAGKQQHGACCIQVLNGKTILPSGESVMSVLRSSAFCCRREMLKCQRLSRYFPLVISMDDVSTWFSRHLWKRQKENSAVNLVKNTILSPCPTTQDGWRWHKEV